MLGDGCVLFINATDLYRFDVETGSGVEILPSGLTWNMALAPDETKLAYTSFNGQEIVSTVRDLASNKEQSVVVTDSASNAQSGDVHWAADGSHFLLTVAHDACNQNWRHSIVRVNVRNGGLTAVTLIEEDDRQFTILDWSGPEQKFIRLRDKNDSNWLLDVKSGDLVQE